MEARKVKEVFNIHVASMLILLSDIRQEFKLGRKWVLCNLRANDSDGSEIPIPELSEHCRLGSTWSPLITPPNTVCWNHRMGIDCGYWSQTAPTCARSDYPTGKSFIGKSWLFSCLIIIIIIIVIKTGDETETLRKVEALIQANFENGLPPHLQSNAKSMVYASVPESNQSRIFVSPHSEFSRMHARDIQRILCNCLILVHGNPSDFNYQWDLESFARLYDVDDNTSVQDENGIPSLKPILAKIVISFNPYEVFTLPP